MKWINLGVSAKIMPFSTTGLNWSGDPVQFGFAQSKLGTQTFSLPEKLPMDACMVRIIAFQRSGYEMPNSKELFRLWTEVAGEDHVHFLYSWRYPQSAISFQAPEFWLPIEVSGRFQ